MNTSQGITLVEYLLRRAGAEVEASGQIGLDTFIEMQSAGMNAQQIEQRLRRTAALNKE